MHRIFHSIGHVVWMTCNLVAVAVLLTADLAAVVPPSKIQVPALLAIGFEALAMLNVVFAVSWLFSSRKSWCLVSVLALLLSLPGLRATFSTTLHPAPAGERSLTVLTYNTHLLQNNTPVGDNELLRYVLESGADIVCMQEYAVYKDAQYPTFQRVKNMLTGVYPYTYFDFSVHNQRLQYGLAVYSKYPLTHKTTIPINATGNGANYCDVLIPDGGSTFTVRLFNNHLQSNSILPSEIDSLLSTSAQRKNFTTVNTKLSTKLAQRAEQVTVIREAIEASPYPVIVCGDFNDVPASYTYHHLSRGLKDAFLSTSLLRTGHTYVMHGLGIRIDYILHSSKMNATDFHIDRVPYSDHYPVRATFTW